MGVLTWLRSIGKPWLGSWGLGRAHEDLELDRIATRIVGLAGTLQLLPYIDSVTDGVGGRVSSAMRRQFRGMVKEPTVKAALLDKVLSVAALDLSTNPGGDTEKDDQAAEFGLHFVNRISGGQFGLRGLPALAECVLLPGLIDGYSVCERTYDIEDRGKWKGKAILDRLTSLDTSLDTGVVDLEIDQFNHVTGIVGKRGNYGKRWDPQAFVIWRHLSIFNNPAGMSDCRAAIRAAWLIDASWKFRAIHLEKYTSPMLKGTYTDPGAQKDQLEAALERAKASTWLSVPAGALVEAIQLSQRGTADYQAAIDDLSREVFLGFSGGTLQNLEGLTAGGRGNTKVHKATADIRKWHLSSNIECVINTQILPDGIDLNFVGAAYPIASTGGIDDSEMATSLAVDVGLNRDLRLKLSRKDLYKRYGRPEPLDAEDTLEPAAAPAPGGAPFAEPANAVVREGDKTTPAAGVPATVPFRDNGLTTSWGQYLGG